MRILLQIYIILTTKLKNLESFVWMFWCVIYHSFNQYHLLSAYCMPDFVLSGHNARLYKKILCGYYFKWNQLKTDLVFSGDSLYTF